MKLGSDFFFFIMICIFIFNKTNADIPSCPNDLTKLEEDGLYSVEPAGESRFKLLRECSLDSLQSKFKKVNHIQLKTNSCQCFIGNWERYNLLNIDKKYSFNVSKSEPIEDCKKGKHFIICKKPGDCYKPNLENSECSMPKYNSLACPKECLKWQNH